MAETDQGQTRTTRALEVIFGLLFIIAGAWALYTAVRMLWAPHGPEAGAWAFAYLIIGLFVLLAGLLLGWKAVEPERAPTKPGALQGIQGRHKPVFPPTPYEAKNACPECGRWDQRITPGCKGCQSSQEP